MPKTRYPKNYWVGERVKVQGWGLHDFGIIVAAKISHHASEYTWVYKVGYEAAGAGAGLGFELVPQVYLRKLIRGTDEVCRD